MSKIEEALNEIFEEAAWTPDCQGKWDFDFTLLRVSSRYWPHGYNRNGKASATSEILLGMHTLKKFEVEAHSESEVKEQISKLVREWVFEYFQPTDKTLNPKQGIGNE